MVMKNRTEKPKELANKIKDSSWE
jgi:hypothetical protein